MFHSYFERKNDDKVLIFNIIYFPNFASLELSPPSDKRRT